MEWYTMVSVGSPTQWMTHVWYSTPSSSQLRADLLRKINVIRSGKSDAAQLHTSALLVAVATASLPERQH